MNKIDIYKSMDISLEEDSLLVISSSDITVNVIVNKDSNLYIKNDNLRGICNINITLNSSCNIKRYVDNDCVNEHITFNILKDNVNFKYKAFGYIREDNTITCDIKHHNKNIISQINYDLVNLNSKLSLKINSYALDDVDNVISDQISNVINIGTPTSIIYPNLFINRDNVAVNHTSYIGIIDKNSTFYLTSKGYDVKEAKNLLIDGFLNKGLSPLDIEILK